MGTEIESNNIPLVDWLCCSVIHQMTVKLVPFLADEISQVWGAQPLRHSRLTFAWLWVDTSLLFFFPFSAPSPVLRCVSFHLFLLWHHIQLISTNIFLFLNQNSYNPYLKLWGVHSSFSSLTVARLSWCCTKLKEKFQMMCFWSAILHVSKSQSQKWIWFTVA